eukprot:gnl/MRDRNA2_/MRDRNA2_248128_c0_seq1.p1 gnl/MRDRNA2_/MRDRNA2_248128_c0~~gnl/MRDRNA2_/MRDRNA2_248128_c0_seq1.p1  ORF type:complete len:188 (+),score=32.77 gnl/MRDRNA2_/MRDRNA2_248128_c0_seq1:153-716(+)
MAAQVVGKPVGVTTDPKNDKGYEDNPSFTCVYYNENDPRVCLCGRDNLKCGAPAPVANLATTGGKAICFVSTVVPITLIIVFMAMKASADDDFRNKFEAIQTADDCGATAEDDRRCVWNSAVAPCGCTMDDCANQGGKKKQCSADHCSHREDRDPPCQIQYSGQNCPNDDNSDNPERLLLSQNFSDT